MFSILRVVALLIGPVIGFLFGRTGEAALVGLGVAAIAIGLELVIERIPLDMLILGAIGAFGGVIVAKGLSWLVFQLDNPTYYAFVSDYSLLINLFFAWVGCMIAMRKKSELDLLDKELVVKGKKSQDAKVVDTSALIDGRVADVAQTGFLDGKIVVPRFVLHELQAVADASDATKRQRGRRGLDILRRLQEETGLQVKIYDKDYPDIKQVDAKILELAKEIGGKVVTTDFNLNKVATLQGISVLNVNDLAGALKPVVLPGDGLMIYLAKEGKEKAQAIGYLDDGTMVVVDEARRLIGKRINVSVNSILQTSAGRMIFARIQDTREAPPDDRPSAPGGGESRPANA
jgi:uncharacterized protein YacL